MAKLLHIESSPRKSRSYSVSVARELLCNYKELHPEDEVETLDLWALELPEFSEETINAKYRIMHGQEHTVSEAAAWSSVVEVFEKFNSADKYVFSVPMWNFGVPYKLKHFIDVITQPGLSFSFSPEEGYSGLVIGKPAVVVYSRGGDYSSEPQKRAFDFQKPYLQTFLGFIGIRDVHEIIVEPTMGDMDTVVDVKSVAFERAAELAREL